MDVGVAASIKRIARTCTLHVIEMATKRLSSSSSKSKKQKWQVSLATFHRWQTEKEKEYQTLSWLRCDKIHESVELLWCASCRKFEDNIRGVKNFSAAWISGSANHKLSNVSDHARSDQHKLSMSLMRADEAKAM